MKIQTPRLERDQAGGAALVRPARAPYLRPAATAVVALTLLAALAGCSSPGAPSASTSGELPMSLKSLDKTVSAGGKANMSVDTKAGATCAITVTYGSAPASAAGLEPTVAGSNGLAAWGWTVDASTPAGTYPIDVKCTSGQQSGELKTEFTVK